MLLLGVDVETTGLDLEKDRITEIGAVLWDTNGGKPIKLMNELCYSCVDYPSITDEITRITGITQDMLNKHAVQPPVALRKLDAMMSWGDYVVAQNGLNFDKPLIEKAFLRAGIERPPCKWIDTKCDIPYPPEIKAPYSLTHLAAQHGIVNQFPHRAVFDVLSMLKILSLYNLDEVIKYANSPAVVVQAIIPAPWEDEGKGKTAAQARRYAWDSSKKIWYKVLKDFQVEAEGKEAPFPIVIVKEKTSA